LKKEEELLESSWKLANNMYRGIWNDRWELIKQAILTSQAELEILNGYSDASFSARDREGIDSWTKYKCVEYRKAEIDKKEDDIASNGSFRLDQEGLIILKSLLIQPEDNILEMYSKSKSTTMYLLQMLNKEQFTLTINQSTPDKYQKLRKSVYETVSKAVESQIRLTGWDPIKFGTSETHVYDKVILDVPSSDEKKVFNDEKLMKKWTDKVSRQNAKKQLLWLISALAATRPGGTVLYVSRCLTPYETDEIIEKVLKKSRTEPKVVKLNLEVGESTTYGWRIIPDASHFGPLYLSKLTVPE